MIQEFVCPNGRMSVNGVCPIFEGDDGQIKDVKKTSTYDAEKEDEFFEFDFEKPTESSDKSADEILKENTDSYNSFVNDKLGISISSPLNTVGRVISAFNNISQYGIMGAIPIIGAATIVGNALNNLGNKKRVNDAIARESVSDLQYRIDKGEFGSNTPTPQDDRRTSQYTDVSTAQSTGSIGSRGSGMEGYGGGADMGGGSPGSSGPGGSDEMGSF